VPVDARFIDTRPPSPAPGSLPAVVARTRARHARRREQVEQLIARFLTSP
jgi:hypothetical protein